MVFSSENMMDTQAAQALMDTQSAQLPRGVFEERVLRQRNPLTSPFSIIGDNPDHVLLSRDEVFRLADTVFSYKLQLGTDLIRKKGVPSDISRSSVVLGMIEENPVIFKTRDSIQKHIFVFTDPSDPEKYFFLRGLPRVEN